jgi:prepilin-type processing-associated H-X9-DG protein
VAVAFSDETRRALDETLGTLPPELDSLPGTALTRGLQWASLDVAVQPEISLRLVIQSQDAAAATALGTIIDRCLESLTKQGQAGGAEAAINAAIGALPRPQVQGDQLVLQRTQTQVASLIREVVAPAFTEARAGAMRKMSLANINMILKMCYTWAASHQDTFPPDLQTLVKDKMLPHGTRNPLRPDLGDAGYVYLPPAQSISKTDGGQMVLYEAHKYFGQGVNVGFADGHVEWVSDQARFKELLKKAEANTTATQPASQPATVDSMPKP